MRLFHYSLFLLVWLKHFDLFEPDEQILRPLGGVITLAAEAKPVAAFLVELELGGDAGFFQCLVHELAVLGNHPLVILGVEEKAGRRVRGNVALTGNGVELMLAGTLGQQGGNTTDDGIWDHW